MPWWLHQKGRKNKKNVKHDLTMMKSSARKRTEAHAEYAMDTDAYNAAYKVQWLAYTPEEREANIARIRTLMEVCGDNGLLASADEIETAIQNGLLPYQDPFTQDDGIVPNDAVFLHSRCVSRREMIRYLESAAEEVTLPRLFDGTTVTLDDMAILDLDASDYRFFNNSRSRTRQRTEVDYIPAVGGSDDEDVEDNDESDQEFIEEPMSPNREEDFRQYRIEVYDEGADEVRHRLTDPTVSVDDFIALLDDEIDVPTTWKVDETSFRLYVPTHPERFPATIKFDVNNEFRLAEQIVTEFYSNHYTNSQRILNNREFYEKLEYLLLEWRNDNNEIYYFDRDEVDSMMLIAVKRRNVTLLELLDRFVTRMPLRRNTGNVIILQDYLDDFANRIVPDRARRYEAITAEMQSYQDRIRVELASKPDRQQEGNYKLSQMRRIVSRIHNLEELEHSRALAELIQDAQS